jgi:hypothetical protein
MATVSFTSRPPVTKTAKAAPKKVAAEEVAQPQHIPAAAEETPVVETTLVVAAPKAVVPIPVAPAPAAHGIAVAEGVEGEVLADDIRLPRINLVQKVGQLADSFHPGSIVFEKSVVLTEGKEPIELIPLRIKTQYQRKRVWGSEEEPEVYDTSAEVIAAGGSLEYGDENYFERIAHIQVALKLPDSVNQDENPEVLDLFPFQNEDGLYALAMWTLASSGFTAVAKPLLTAASGLLRHGLWNGRYKVTSELRRNAANSWYAPSIRFAGKNSPEDADFFRSIAGI